MALLAALAGVADAPVHSLPWYFGAALFGIWAAALFGLAVLVRRRLKAKAERRRESQRSPRRSGPPGPIRDDRSLGPGSDVERW